jgi:hypothetical protein
VVRIPVKRTIRVPAGASNRQLAVEFPDGAGSASAAFSAPPDVSQELAVSPPPANEGTQPIAAFGWLSGSVQDVTK